MTRCSQEVPVPGPMSQEEHNSLSDVDSEGQGGDDKNDKQP